MRTIPNNYSHYKPINSEQREIRVLVLQPAADAEHPVICSLVRSSLLTEEPCYEAISYCWGSLDNTKALRVRHLEDSVRLRGNGLCDAGGQIRTIPDSDNNSAKEYQVTKSLHAALVEFRDHGKPRFLWADAICINQGDVTERSAQVGFMRHVYSSASQVLVWLFPPSRDSLESIVALGIVLDLVEAVANKTNMTLDVLMSHVDRIDEFAALWEDFPSIPVELQGDDAVMNSTREQQFLRWLLGPSPTRPTVFGEESFGNRRAGEIMKSRTARQTAESAEFMYDFLSLMKPRTLDLGYHKARLRVLQRLDQVNRIFAFDWFSRMWVLQEAGSNSNVTICHGGQGFQWQAIQASAFIQASLLYVSSIRWVLAIPSLFFVLTAGRKRRRIASIELLGWTRDFESTDVRDRLYALHGLTKELAVEQGLPSWIAPDYSKTRHQVFVGYTRWSICHNGSLDILSLITQVTLQETLTERLPSWVPNYGEWIPNLLQTIGPYSSYMASGRRDARSTQFDSKGTIFLKGAQVNSVASTVGFEFDSWNNLVPIGGDVNGTQVAPLSAVWQLLKEAICSVDHNVHQPGAGAIRKEIARREHLLFHQFLRYFSCTAAKQEIYHEERLVRDHMPDELAELYACLYWNSRHNQLAGLALTWSEESSIRRLVRASQRHNFSLRKSSFLAILGRTLRHRRFFTTPDQDFGLGPRHVREGDLVVLLDGGSVPYILRERPWQVGTTALEKLREGPCYDFIGECYVETLMDGREAGKAGIADDSNRCKYDRKVFRIM